MIIKREIHGHRIVAECSESNSRTAASVLDTFMRLAASGTPIRVGTQIRFGWSLLRLADDRGALRVTEPDFARWPEPHWVPTIDVTLNTLAVQTQLLHRLKVDGEDVFFDQSIIAARGAVEQPNIFLRHGSSIAAEDSGWVLGTLDDPEALSRGEDLEAVSIASLVVHRPGLLQVLTLPSDFVVLFSGDLVEQIYDADGCACLSANA